MLSRLKDAELTEQRRRADDALEKETSISPFWGCSQPGARSVPQPRGESKREVYCANRKTTASIAIKPAINNNEIVAAILFTLRLSFHDPRPWLVAVISSSSAHDLVDQQAFADWSTLVWADVAISKWPALCANHPDSMPAIRDNLAAALTQVARLGHEDFHTAQRSSLLMHDQSSMFPFHITTLKPRGAYHACASPTAQPGISITCQSYVGHSLRF
jgi:hypothetical protein